MVWWALVAARLATTALYHVSPADPASLTGAVVFVDALGLLAAYVPARRAMKVDPMLALRNE